MNNLSPAQMLLLSRLVNDEASSIELEEGTHNTDAFSVSVTSGILDVNAPETYTGTVAVPWLEAIVVGLQRAGFQREGIWDIIVDGASVCIEGDHKVSYKDTLSYVAKGKKDLQAKLKAERGMQKVRKGKVFVRSGNLSSD